MKVILHELVFTPYRKERFLDDQEIVENVVVCRRAIFENAVPADERTFSAQRNWDDLLDHSSPSERMVHPHPITDVSSRGVHPTDTCTLNGTLSCRGRLVVQIADKYCDNVCFPRVGVGQRVNV